MTQDILNWSLLGVLLLWMIFFTVLAVRPAKDKHAREESHAGEANLATVTVESQARKTQPRLAAIQQEARKYRPHNTGEVEAVGM